MKPVKDSVLVFYVFRFILLTFVVLPIFITTCIRGIELEYKTCANLIRFYTCICTINLFRIVHLNIDKVNIVKSGLKIIPNHSTIACSFSRTFPSGNTAVGLGTEQLGPGRGPGVVRTGPGQTGELHNRRDRKQPRTDRGLSAGSAPGPVDVRRRRVAHVSERVRTQRRRGSGQEQLPGGRHHQPATRV